MGCFLDQIADPTTPDLLSSEYDDAGVTHFLLGVRPWEAWEDGEPAAVMAKSRAMEQRGESEVAWGTCATCRRRRLSRSEYCARCDRCGFEKRAAKLGLPVGYAIDPKWKAEPTKYVPDKTGRKGGKR